MDQLAPGGNGNDRYAKVAESILLCGSNSVVECDLAKVEVAGSNPVSRSICLFDLSYLRQIGVLQSAPSPSGKAEVCKTSIPGSNPGGASSFSNDLVVNSAII